MMYYSENLARVYAGDCRHMTDIPDNSVHCVVTSPPYYGLRRYKGLEDLVWGGNPECQHEWQECITAIPNASGGQNSPKQATVKGSQFTDYHNRVSKSDFCQLCGAWRGQLGSEPTIEMFIAHLVEVFREVKRVLRLDGIAWCNIGDSMAGSGSPCGDYRDGKGGDDYLRAYNRNGNGLKPLDACLIPFRLALALQADGWYVRQDIIWSKNNPMPESLQSWRWEKHKVKQCPQCKALDSFKNQKCQKCGYSNKENRGTEPSRNTTDNRPQQDHDGKDFKQSVTWEDCPGCPKCTPNDGLVLRQGAWRPTNAHEYIFMLTKTDNYYCDREAVKEAQTESTINHAPRKTRTLKGENEPGVLPTFGSQNDVGGRNLRSVWQFSTFGFTGWTPSLDGADYVGDDGKPYKVSLDCPIHGQQFLKDKHDKASCGEQLSHQPNGMSGIDNGHASEQQDEQTAKMNRNYSDALSASVPMRIAENKNVSKIEVLPHDTTSDAERLNRTNRKSDLSDVRDDNSDCLSQSNAPIATENSKKSHRKGRVPVTNPSCNVSDERVYHIGDKLVQPSKFDLVDHIDENKNEGDCASSEKLTNLSAETLSHTVHKSQPNYKCTCKINQVSHFATFPPELPRRCIKAATSEVGVCSKCGKQWTRVIGESEPIPTRHGVGKKMIEVIEEQRGETSLKTSVFSTGCVLSSNTLGWRPSCKCGAPAVPATCLDPFAGSGTTLAVAKSLGHIGIGYELSTEYLPMIKKRLQETPEGELSNQMALI